ncbi:ubiquitin-like domain-containing protein [Streptomyces lydicus]|uniref:ubiquitin-like domain-containing protein n=1 Tax=Streptomyces lydicus TaxID=47763 RepID=UPI00369BDADC
MTTLRTGVTLARYPRSATFRPSTASGHVERAVSHSPSTHRAARSRRRRRAAHPEALRRLLPRAVVVAFLAGGTTAFIAHDKAVRLTVDGTPRTLHTFAHDVDDLLADEHLGIGPHDIVAPAPGTELTSGDEVVVRHGRPVVLTIDGHRRTVWTTAGTVAETLRQLGVRAEGAYLSASRSRRIERHGMELAVRTERSVVFLADGREYRIRTNAATVREALAEAGLGLRDQDTTSVPPDSFPREGQTVSVLRITGSKEVREEPVPFRTVHRPDPTLSRGTVSVVQQGRPGVRRVTYRLRTVNGVKQKPKRLRTEVVRAARPQIVHLGTRVLPRTVRGAEHLAWGALARCEAGGRPHAVDSSGTYGGLYQFDVATWRALGGRGRPQDAPAEEQTYRAKKLYITRGATPWPVCGRKLHG